MKAASWAYHVTFRLRRSIDVGVLGLACILNESDFCMLTIHSEVGVVVYVCTCKNNFYLPY